jgi:hypothetical protein
LAVLKRSTVGIVIVLTLIAILGLVLYDQHAGPTTPKHLEVVDVGSFCKADAMLTYVTLQGVVNKVAPRIYFIYDWQNGSTDREWLQDTLVPAGYSYNEISDPMNLVNEFKNEINGVVVVDPELNASINIATTICGLTDSIATTPEMLGRLQSSGFHIVADLRDKWTNDIDAYRWAYRDLYLNCSEKALASLDPADMQLRDYLVGHRVFTFWINSRYDAPSEDQALLDDILANKPEDIPVLGWWNDEESGVQKTSEHGKYVLATDLAPNLSVHSRVKTTLPLNRPVDAQEPVLNADKVYVAFAISDGDNIQYCMNRMREPLWQDAARGSIPIGWTISPSLLDFAPRIAQWYYQNATSNDYFLCGPTGIGTAYPDSQADIISFLNHSNVYCSLLNLHAVWTLGARNPETLREMTSNMTYINAFFQEYGMFASSYKEPHLIGNKLIMPCSVWSENIDSTVRQIRNYTNSVASRPLMIFVGATCWKMTPSKLETVMNTLGQDGEFEFVRPDQLVSLTLNYLMPPS